MSPEGEVKMLALLEDISRKLTDLQMITQGTLHISGNVRTYSLQSGTPIIGSCWQSNSQESRER